MPLWLMPCMEACVNLWSGTSCPSVCVCLAPTLPACPCSMPKRRASAWPTSRPPWPSR